MDIHFVPMTRELMHAFFRQLVYDPATFAESTTFREYIYDPDCVDAYFDKHLHQGKVHFAIVRKDTVIGDLYFKHINESEKICEISIYLVNDSVKNKGYGTFSEVFALNHAFSAMHMSTVTAKALIRNTRSCHVLEKAGFRRFHSDSVYHYYRCHSTDWREQP